MVLKSLEETLIILFMRMMTNKYSNDQYFNYQFQITNLVFTVRLLRDLYHPVTESTDRPERSPLFVQQQLHGSLFVKRSFQQLEHLSI